MRTWARRPFLVVRAVGAPAQRVIMYYSAAEAIVVVTSSVRTMTRPTRHVVRPHHAVTTAAVPKTMTSPTIQNKLPLFLLLVSVVFFVLPSSSSATTDCPTGCMCFKTTVRCMFLQLDGIPDHIPPATTVL